MRKHRSRPARRMRHPARLVSAARPRILLDDDEAEAWYIGGRAAWALYEYWPAFYAEQGLDQRPCTLPQLLGCSAAMFQLTEEAGARLRWPGDWGGDWQGLTRRDIGDTPAETLYMYTGVHAGYLAEMGPYIWSPQPEYFGWGARTILERQNWPEDLLRPAIWWMLQHTHMALGIELASDEIYQYVGAGAKEEIRKLRPLPAMLPAKLFAYHLQLPIADEYGIDPIDLLGYAVGHTSNELANFDDVDRMELYMGEFDDEYSWKDVAELARASQQAQAIELAYTAWSAQITSYEAMRAVAAELRRAARAAQQELQQGPKTLAEILAAPDANNARYDPELAELAEAPGAASFAQAA